MNLARHAYYYTLRLKARQVVADAFIARFKKDGGKDNWNLITLASIDRDALEFARLEWVKYYSDDSFKGFSYSWEAIHKKFCARPSHFDISIWQNLNGSKVLQGLAIGRPSRGKTHLTVNWVERSFAPTYLRGGILLPVLACAEEYARLLGCKRVLIKNPIDPAVYERYGYTEYQLPSKVSARYFAKELRHGTIDAG